MLIKLFEDKNIKTKSSTESKNKKRNRIIQKYWNIFIFVNSRFKISTEFEFNSSQNS